MSEWMEKNLWILVLAAVILAAVLAKGRCSEDMEIIGAFFEIVGDILALLALQPGVLPQQRGEH